MLAKPSQRLEQGLDRGECVSALFHHQASFDVAEQAARDSSSAQNVDANANAKEQSAAVQQLSKAIEFLREVEREANTAANTSAKLSNVELARLWDQQAILLEGVGDQIQAYQSGHDETVDAFEVRTAKANFL